MTVATDESWSAVLAAVEADMLRATELMATSAEAAASRDAMAAPAQTMLPALPATFRQYAEATWAVLPDFDQMPPIPPELLERIHRLRVQIVTIQAEMAAEMARWRASCATNRTTSLPVPTSEPLYVDRLA